MHQIKQFCNNQRCKRTSFYSTTFWNGWWPSRDCTVADVSICVFRCRSSSWFTEVSLTWRCLGFLFPFFNKVAISFFPYSDNSAQTVRNAIFLSSSYPEATSSYILGLTQRQQRSFSLFFKGNESCVKDYAYYIWHSCFICGKTLEYFKLKISNWSIWSLVPILGFLFWYSYIGVL